MLNLEGFHLFFSHKFTTLTAAVRSNGFWPSSFIACCHNSNFTKTAYELLTNESYYFTANIPAIELLDFGSFKVTIVVLVGFDVIQSSFRRSLISLQSIYHLFK